MSRAGLTRWILVLLITVTALWPSSPAVARGGYIGHPSKPRCPAETKLGRFFDRITNLCPSHTDKEKVVPLDEPAQIVIDKK
jgi:hypothetical protein